MVYRFALRGANVVTANAHRGLPPAAEPACLPAGNPLTRVAGRNGYRPCFAGAREEARTGGGRHPDTADQNHRGARHRPSDHEELSDIGFLVLSAHVEIGHAMADRISRVGDFSICVLSPSARSTANGSPTPRIRSPRPIGPLATATTCRSCGPSSPWTQMLDTPISGRIFLEQVIRDKLDIGRPEQVGLVFDPRPIRRGPRATPGRFPDQGDHRRGHPRACTWTTNTPRSSSKGIPRAPRPSSPTPTISGSGNDRRICPRSGRSATPPTGACSASNESATTRSPGPDPCTPSPHPSPPRPAPASQACARGERRSHALLTALPLFRAQPNGVANKDLRPLIAELRAAPPDAVTYDL
jgi:hypothetical protein